MLGDIRFRGSYRDAEEVFKILLAEYLMQGHVGEEDIFAAADFVRFATNNWSGENEAV